MTFPTNKIRSTTIVEQLWIKNIKRVTGNVFLCSLSSGTRPWHGSDFGEHLQGAGHHQLPFREGTTLAEVKILGFLIFLEFFWKFA